MRRQLHANLTQAYDISYNDSSQAYVLTEHTDSPIPNNPAGGSAAVPHSYYEAHDTQEVSYADPGWGTDQMWEEAWKGDASRAYSERGDTWHECHEFDTENFYANSGSVGPQNAFSLGSAKGKQFKGGMKSYGKGSKGKSKGKLC